MTDISSEGSAVESALDQVPPEAIEPLRQQLQSLPEAQREAILKQVRVTLTRSFSGPFPPPWYLDDYERHHPGFLLALTERSLEAQRHEQEMDRIFLEGPLQYASRGQFYGFAITSASIVGACFCAWIGQPWVAGVLGLTSATPIIGMLIKNPLMVRRDEQAEDATKASNTNPKPLQKPRAKKASPKMDAKQ